MAVQIKDQSSKKAKNGKKVIPLEKLRKKAYYDRADYQTSGISSASFIDIANSMDSMWQAPKIEGIHIDKGDGDDPPSVDKDVSANDDNVLCQHLDKGLSMWLEAYTGIGKDRNRPVSRFNPARSSPINLTEQQKLQRLKNQGKSYGARISRGQRITEDHTGKPIWRVNNRGEYPRDGVLTVGWGKYTPRPPTMAQLLVQAYSKGFTFALESSRSKTILIEDEHADMSHWDKLGDVKAKTDPKHDLEYWKYQAALKNMSMLDPDFSMRDYNLYSESCNDRYLMGKCQRIYEDLKRSRNEERKFIDRLSEAIKYDKWLYKHMITTPTVYEMPMQHVGEFGGMYGDRYVGRKAAEFIPKGIRMKPKTFYGDVEWNRYLCYYLGYCEGRISLNQLQGLANYIYGVSDTCNAVFDSEVRSSQCETSESQCLALPAPKAVTVEEPVPVSNRVERDVYNEVLASQHPSGTSQAQVFNFVLHGAWKKLGNMLMIPKSYDPDQGSVIIPLTEDVNQDKFNQLKTG